MIDRHFEEDAAEAADVRRYLDVLRLRWITVVFIGLLVAGVITAVQLRKQDKFTSEILIQRKQDSAHTDLIPKGVQNVAVNEVASSQIEILRSGAVLGPVVDATGLRANWGDAAVQHGVVVESSVRPGTLSLEVVNGTGTLSRGGRVVGTGPIGELLSGGGISLTVPKSGSYRITIAERTETIKKLRRQLALQQVRATSLIRARYTSASPELAAAVLNQLGESYAEYAAVTAQQNARRRREFIAGRLAQVADSLAAAQNELRRYQQASGTVDPRAEGQALIDSEMNAQRELSGLRYQESTLESASNALRSGREYEEALRRTVALGRDFVPGVEGLYGRLQDLNEQRSRLTASRFGSTASSGEVVVLDSLIATAKSEIASMTAQALQITRSRRIAAEERLGRVADQIRNLPAKTSDMATLQQRVAGISQTYDLLAERYYEAQIAEAAEGGDVEVLDAAQAPTKPDPRHRQRTVALALLAGLLIGCLAALLQDFLDRRVRHAEDAERTAGLKIIGMIPRIVLKPANGTSYIGMLAGNHERTNGAEGFRTIRTMLRFSEGGNPKLIAITSAGPGEGKSTIAANLAVAFSEQGERVLLVDSDFARPVQHELARLSKGPGLAEVLRDAAPLDLAAVQITEHLAVLPAGHGAKQYAYLLSSEALPHFFRSVKAQYDRVIIDCAPILAVSDAAVISREADGVLVVTRVNKSDRFAMRAAILQLRQLNTRLLGLVLNEARAIRGYGYYGLYQYGNYYQSAEKVER